MSITKPMRLCLVPRLSGVGGMVSFQAKLAKGLADNGIETTFNLDDTPYHSVLVIGGTRHLPQLWRVKHRGVRIIQRLDGMNWLHRSDHVQIGQPLCIIGVNQLHVLDPVAQFAAPIQVASRRMGNLVLP